MDVNLLKRSPRDPAFAGVMGKAKPCSEVSGGAFGVRPGLPVVAQRTIRSISHFAFEYGGLSMSPPVNPDCQNTGRRLLRASKPARAW